MTLISQIKVSLIELIQERCLWQENKWKPHSFQPQVQPQKGNEGDTGGATETMIS